jgi:glyoxylase-like metal-dependent hydrolase (beta-lactamase superfamily II)
MLLSVITLSRVIYMKVHALSTGDVRITRRWVEAKDDGLRLIRTLADNQFTDWMPVWCFAIEHPEGLIVIDTGSTANAAPVYFPPWMPLIARIAHIRLTPEQELGPLMIKQGFALDDVRWVVMTHLHQDHDGGMKYFPKAELVVSRSEWAVATGFGGRMGGYMNHRWPKWLAPTLIDFDRDRYGPFPASYTLTKAKDVRLVPTQGHSAGHLSVILEEGEMSVLFGGDTAYSQAMLLADGIDGLATSPADERLAHRRIMEYAVSLPTVYLPSHEWDAERRLAEREPIPRGAASYSLPNIELEDLQ